MITIQNLLCTEHKLSIEFVNDVYFENNVSIYDVNINAYGLEFGDTIQEIDFNESGTPPAEKILNIFKNRIELAKTDLKKLVKNVIELEIDIDDLNDTIDDIEIKTTLEINVYDFTKIIILEKYYTPQLIEKLEQNNFLSETNIESPAEVYNIFYKPIEKKLNRCLNEYRKFKLKKLKSILQRLEKVEGNATTSITLAPPQSTEADAEATGIDEKEVERTIFAGITETIFRNHFEKLTTKQTEYDKPLLSKNDFKTFTENVFEKKEVSEKLDFDFGKQSFNKKYIMTLFIEFTENKQFQKDYSITSKNCFNLLLDNFNGFESIDFNNFKPSKKSSKKWKYNLKSNL